MSQGYDDNAEEAEEGDEDEDDGTYADEEYGRKKATKKKKQPASYPKPRRVSLHPSSSPLSTDLFTAVPTRKSPSDSDSDSDYGSRSKKKKKSRLSGDEVRVSSRGVKVPNYVDDVADFEKFDDSDDAAGAYYVDPNVQYKEEDEIEAVLSHQRDEDKVDDPEDNWYDNIVSSLSVIIRG